MSNTYGNGRPLLDPLDPLERYALEPVPEGFLDDDTFASDYNQGIIGTSLLRECETADPAITGVQMPRLADGVRFRVSLTNYGSLEACYVPLTVFAGTLDSTPIVNRVIERIAPGGSVIHQLTLPDQSLNDSVLFVLSHQEELSGDDPSNNRYVASTERGDIFRRGDTNTDATVDISDPIYLLFFLFRGRVEISCMKSADANDDGRVDIADVLTLLTILFRADGVEAIREPFGTCGLDPTRDGLTCESTSTAVACR